MKSADHILLLKKAHRLTLVGEAITSLSAGSASRTPATTATARNVTLPICASSPVNVYLKANSVVPFLGFMGTNCVKEPNCWKPPGTLRNSWTSTVAAYGLRSRRRPAIQRRDQELDCVVSVGRIPMHRVEAGAGRPVAKPPLRRLEADEARIEGEVLELHLVEHRRIERGGAEVRLGRWRNVEAELDRPALAEQATDQEVVGRPGLGPERHVPTEHVTANFVHAGHRATSVRSDHARNRSVDDSCRD